MLKFNRFLLEKYKFEARTNVLHLFYAYENGPSFEERIEFPETDRILSATDIEALDRAFRLIFLLAGVSYYKAYIPKEIHCTAFQIDKETAHFVETVYQNGLGEFAYRNNFGLDFSVKTDLCDAPAPLHLSLPHRNLVPVGGGKDSIVTIECLKKSNAPVTLFALGPESGIAKPIQDTIKTSGLRAVTIKRTLSPVLFDLNKQGAYNGHVPITAILSSISVASAVLYGCDSVLLSNEHSASAPNLEINGQKVNHQYSKSIDFERDFSAFVKSHISPDISYFSFLRPLTEVAITRRFARLEEYHPVFRSCNTAFRQDENLRGKNWCCDCPKCRFVFLALAPFMEKEKLVSLFGKDLLDDNTQLEGFKELCGLSAHKPFECVGEISECVLVMRKLSQMNAWKNNMVVRKIAQDLPQYPDFEERYNGLFANRDDHLLPENYLEILDACQ